MFSSIPQIHKEECFGSGWFPDVQTQIIVSQSSRTALLWRKEDEQTEESVSGPERTAADSHADLQVDAHIYMSVHIGSVPSVPYMS